MNPEHPWSPLPILPKGDANGDLTYRAVGIALSRWEELEGVLAELFRLLIGAETRGAHRAYGTVVAFQGRQQMLKAAIPECPLFHTPSLDGLEALVDLIGRFAARRNEIAHGHVIHPLLNGVDRGIYLCAAEYNANKRPAIPADANEFMFGKYAYTSDQILHFAGEFQKLTRRASAYIIPLQSHWAEQRRRMRPARNSAEADDPV